MTETRCYQSRLEAIRFLYCVPFLPLLPYTTDVFGILGDRYDLVGIEALKIVLFIKHNPFSDICVGIPQNVDVGTVLDVRCDYDAARCATAHRNGLL